MKKNKETQTIEFENVVPDDTICYCYYLVYGQNSGLVYQGYLDDNVRVAALFTKEDALSWIEKSKNRFPEPLIAVECRIFHKDIFFVKATSGAKQIPKDKGINLNVAH